MVDQMETLTWCNQRLHVNKIPISEFFNNLDKERKKMDETLQTQDPLRDSMAEAHVLETVVDPYQDGCPVSEPSAETPQQVEVSFVQTEEELTGTPVIL